MVIVEDKKEVRRQRPAAEVDRTDGSFIERATFSCCPFAGATIRVVHSTGGSSSGCTTVIRGASPIKAAIATVRSPQHADGGCGELREKFGPLR